MIRSFALVFGLGLMCSAPAQDVTDSTVAELATAVLRREATALEPLVTSRLAKNFLNATSDLLPIRSRKLFLNEAKKIYSTEAEAGILTEVARQGLKKIPVDEVLYYTTKYGSPLAYARPLDVLGQSGLSDVAGLKILDFGYGTIGHLRLLAQLGADVTGVDVDPLLRALYSALEDQGIVKNKTGPDGRIRLIDGRFPADEAIKTAVGGHYDLIISKNTLKRGYVHPERPVDPRRLLNLGVNDAVFVKSLHDALKPGGRVLIYNISPAPSLPDQPYKNWADGRCPFANEVWESVGFDVIAFDRDDTEAIHKVAAALGWDRGESPINLKTDLFARYSLMRARATPGSRR